MAWSKNGTPDTLSSAGDTMTISDLTATTFNQFLVHKIDDLTGGSKLDMTFNNNANSVYANRREYNGGADSTNISQTNIRMDVGADFDNFLVLYVCSVSGEEKLLIGHECTGNTAGAGNATERAQHVLKFVPSPDADITRIDFNNDDIGDFATSSNLSALGTD
jgi:hypothetical protein